MKHDDNRMYRKVDPFKIHCVFARNIYEVGKPFLYMKADTNVYEHRIVVS